MTNIEKLAAEALADDAKATPGPWAMVAQSHCVDDGTRILTNFNGSHLTWANADEEGCLLRRDAELIVNARTGYKLLAEYVAKVAPLIEALRLNWHDGFDSFQAAKAILDATKEQP